MDAQSKKIIGIFIRYFFLLFISVGNLYLFYKILTPLTIFSVSRTLSLFTNISVSGIFINLNTLFTIELVRACVAGSAFFLMFILIFSTPDIKPLKRFLALLTATTLLFLLNYTRIILLVLLYFTENPYYNLVHWVLWHLVSVFLVVGIWLLTIKIYKIKSIPIYSDIKYLFNFVLKKKQETQRREKHK